MTGRRTLGALVGLVGIVGIVGPVALAGLVAGAGGAAAAPAGVEATYAAPGPAAGAVATGVVRDGSGAVTHRLYHPADLGPPGERHPVVAWGNGSFEHPDRYEPLLRHLASWGFVVVAAETDSAGTGDEIRAGARHVVAADADPASPFFERIDRAHVGAAGHSQGAGGAVRAATAAPDLLTTVVPVALPAELYQLLGVGHDYHPDRLWVPVLFLSGSDDVLISPAGAVAGYYDRVPGAAAMAILIGADHNAVQVDGGGFRGYLTAWLRWQLAGDEVAGRAFVGPDAELLTNPRWRDQRVKGLGGPSGPSGPPAGVPTAGAALTQVVPPATPTAAPLPATGGALPLPAPFALAAAALAVRRASAGPAR